MRAFDSIVRRLPRSRTGFDAALNRYGQHRCSVAGETLLVGLGPNPQYRRLALTETSFQLTSVCFLEAPEQAGLVAHYVASREALAVESLMIGTSHDYMAKEPTRHRQQGAVDAISRGYFPALKRLSLGDMEKLFNGSSIFGQLGDVQRVFDAAPRLETLALHGDFALSRPVSHRHLRNLSVWVQEIGGTEGPLSQETVDNLLLSDCPEVRDVSLQLEEWDAVDYAIPERFFSHNGWPSLTRLHIDTLTPEAAQHLDAWKAERNIT